MIYFTLGGVLYAAYITISSYKQVHDTSWYLPVGLCIALLANLSWLLLTRTRKTPTEILIDAIWWDAMVVGISIAVPIFLFGATPSKWQILGISLIALGIFFTHKT